MQQASVRSSCILIYFIICCEATVCVYVRVAEFMITALPSSDKTRAAARALACDDGCPQGQRGMA